MVKHYFGCYDPLQYPLIFPSGEIGWHRYIKTRYEASVLPNITCEEDIIENSISASNARCPDDQKSKSVIARETRGDKIGKRTVLPSSFIGGPRDMRRRYFDAMSLVQKFGKPDLFITMTCNPEWKEIREELEPGHQAQDRPDLTSRVFRAKLQDVKHQLFTKCIFGKMAAHVHVIEFQKRGLPHAHILIILQPEYKITNADQYDKFVSAEISKESENSILYERVIKHMMHVPCGELNSKNACMKGGKYKNHCPRQFVENLCKKTQHFFKGRVQEIQNANETWYMACKKCKKKVEVSKEGLECSVCQKKIQTVFSDICCDFK